MIQKEENEHEEERDSRREGGVFVAKTLVKEFKTATDDNCLLIIGNFTDVCSNKFNGTHLVFRSGYKEEVYFGELADESLDEIVDRLGVYF